MTLDEFLQKNPLPNTSEGTVEWAKKFYDSEPTIRNFLDELWSPLKRTPNDREITQALQPFFKLLVIHAFSKVEGAEMPQFENNSSDCECHSSQGDQECGNGGCCST